LNARAADAGAVGKDAAAYLVVDLEVVELVEEVARVGGQPAHGGDGLRELLVPDPSPARGPRARGAEHEVGAPQLGPEARDLLLRDAVAGGPRRSAVADEPLGHHTDQPRRRADGLADGVERERHRLGSGMKTLHCSSRRGPGRVLGTGPDEDPVLLTAHATRYRRPLSEVARKGSLVAGQS